MFADALTSSEVALRSGVSTKQGEVNECLPPTLKGYLKINKNS